MESKLIVAPPKIEDRSFDKPLLCGPGPANHWPSVDRALSNYTITPMCEEHFKVIDDIRAGLKYLFQTKSDLVLAVSGAGHTGMETIISNVVAPGQKLLIARRGIWDERAFEIATRYRINAVVDKIPMTQTFDLKHLEKALIRERPAALFITHGDSSTGTIQKLEGLGDLCHKYNTLLLVDTVVSIPAVPFFMDDWGIDAVYTSTQKALSGPAGISSVAFSKKAENIINTRDFKPPFYFDVKLLAQQWNCYGNTRVYHHTLSSPLIWALRCCLQELSKETLPKCWARHEAATAHFHKKLRQFSFQFLIPKPEDRLITVTTLTLPNKYDYLKFVKHLRANYGIVIFGGLGPTAGKAIRVGLMGVNATVEIADRVADGMANTLKDLTSSSL